MAHSFYSCREPFYFEQSGWGLIERHLRSNRHQRRNNIQHGRWSWCLHQLEHQFGWSRSQANNEDLLLQIRQSRSIHPLLTIKFCGGHVKISRPRSQLDPGNFAISSPSAWNFLRVYLPDPGFNLITLRWNVNAFLSSLLFYLLIECST